MIQITDKAYREHEIFENLTQYGEFYDSLSMSVFQQVTTGTTAFANIDTYVFSSIQGTVESMAYLLGKGRINDAFALLRKYHDAATINVYVNLWLRHHCTPQTPIVPFVNDWLHGRSTKALPRVEEMTKYIEKSGELGTLFKLINSDERYKQLRKRCNDQMHYNFFHTTLLNDGAVYVKDRLVWLNTFSEDLRCIAIYHLALIFGLKDSYLMSSDYMDYMECGERPPDDCQYWVNPIVQKMLDRVVVPFRPDVYKALKEGSAMHLD
ncbi:hypothetical protein [Agrobacterium tumefaciens]|uniref:hypothetical protein n=1 Tax=Agrobacterium tumefaciens TaxID=358 RepID=UPI0021D2B500|nr:hypothetical protein [Agrobacterium tumefaciens]UXS26935.1 hypothetical protein FY153_20970 [Agrobacterium tumefaciens]UXS54566.1 hypothetical protein FY148_17800 [Agrobacterium tumefaciens]UXS65461.1 hypothetical protein FY147_21395 [Agrobacterium tumefaciens]